LLGHDLGDLSSLENPLVLNEITKLGWKNLTLWYLLLHVLSIISIKIMYIIEIHSWSAGRGHWDAWES
jgi:hypothetical protein